MKNKKSVTAFMAAMLGAASIFGAIIPADRMTDWTPGVNTGVPGGIPARAVIGATVNAATYGTGNVDASAAIGAAIDACPSGQVVFIPAGTYRLDSRVYRANANNITIRGAGTGATILKASSNSQLLLLGTSDWPRPTSGVAITSGATQGSSVLTVASTSSITVGKLVRVAQNDLPYVIYISKPDSNNKLLSCLFKVTAKTATTVTVAPPLPFTFTLSPMLVQYNLGPLTSTGVEDLTFDCNSVSGIALQIEQSWGCWVKNCEVKNSTNRQMLLSCFVNGEIRHCYTHATTSGGPNHEGIDLMVDCSFCLVEDNITYDGGFPGIILGDGAGGCTGNVIAYNFSYNANTGYANTAGMDISVSHGPHNLMNLVEGNIASGVGSDGYFGSTSHITIARNWITVTHPTCTDNLLGINVGRWNNYFNIIGNIIGTSAFSSAGLFQPEVSFSYSDQVIYKIGFPNMGNNGYTGTWGPTTPPSYVGQAAHQTGSSSLQELDLNAKNTMIRHGNYDYKNKSVAWEATIADHVIPDSYFRTSKPGYFGNLAWPPFDPASPPGAFNDANIIKIPAGYRYVNGIDPPGSITVEAHAPVVTALSSDAFYRIYNMQGRLVRTFKGEWSSDKITAVRFMEIERGLPNGIYLARITGNGASFTTKRLVIR